jgi:HPt (histidine-containing phosphotransfer) domain-containing protein
MANPFESEDRPDLSTDERRKWARFLARVGEVRLRLNDGEERPATAVDESFGGIGIVVEDATGLDFGREVVVSYDGTTMDAIVKYIAPDRQGRHRIGLQWQIKHDLESGQHKRLAQLESRLFALFRLLEIGDWEGLANAATLLREEARTIGADALCESAARLQQQLEENRTRNGIQCAIEAIVDACSSIRP